ncbi:cation:proton antiporter [Moorena sp. SIO4E2]|uniref:cation:proton antiporter n=1 Tax=Moorena sp. SIO4E2 TaxID=2607826 RepID=UPI00257CA99C|nr:cation:proton antiporter [Moorena sp. SIO4E2]
MIEEESIILLLVLLVGATLILTILIKAGLEQVGMPAIVGYLLLGFLMRLVDVQEQLLSAQVLEVYGFFAELGIISLLFRVGLESNLSGLLSQLPRASIILVGNLILSGILGFVSAYFLLQLPLIPSLFISIALIATSVGISVSVWQEAKALNSVNGELLLDIAEMDDIAAIVLMSLLFAVVPVLNGEVEANFLPVLTQIFGPFLLKVVFFSTFCLVFFNYFERPLTRFFEKIEPAPDPMLMVAGTGFIIAALAGLLGFSVAVGAFFAGLVFSRDPEAVKLDASFSALYELFVPFFFINIGLQLESQALTAALGLGSILVIVAVLGKIIGTGGPAMLTVGWSSAVLLSISMVPRAEIAMVIMQRGRYLGDWAVPPEVFAAMAMVSAVTCIFSPLLLRPLLQKWVLGSGYE